MSRTASSLGQIAIVFAAAVGLTPSNVEATILTFLDATGYDSGTGDFGSLGPIGGEGYGDRVDFGVAASGADAYGGYLRGQAWTPNVTVDYRSGASGNIGVGLSWGATLDRLDESSDGAFSNGNDTNGNPIITYKSVWPQQEEGVRPEVILTPDPGYAVVLRNYLLEAFFPETYILDGRTTEVRTASDQVLFSYTEPGGNGYRWNYYGVDGYTAFNSENGPIVSTEPIRIIGDATWWRTISAIDFSQIAVPEPTATALLIAGMLGTFGVYRPRRD